MRKPDSLRQNNEQHQALRRVRALKAGGWGRITVVFNEVRDVIAEFQTTHIPVEISIDIIKTSNVCVLFLFHGFLVL